MNIPHKCPVCEGKGEVKKRLAQVGSVLVSEPKKPMRFRCHGCVGTGVVWEFAFVNIPSVWTRLQTSGDVTYTNGECPGIVNPDNDVFSNPGFEFVSDHICGRMANPPKRCDYCISQGRVADHE